MTILISNHPIFSIWTYLIRFFVSKRNKAFALGKVGDKIKKMPLALVLDECESATREEFSQCCVRYHRYFNAASTREEDSFIVSK